MLTLFNLIVVHVFVIIWTVNTGYKLSATHVFNGITVHLCRFLGRVQYLWIRLNMNILYIGHIVCLYVIVQPSCCPLGAPNWSINWLDFDLYLNPRGYFSLLLQNAGLNNMFALCPQTNMLTQAPLYYRFYSKIYRFYTESILFCFDSHLRSYCSFKKGFEISAWR